MDGEEIVQQLGLLLSQVRYARHSLENIERSTSRYAGLALTAAAGGPTGTPWGAPPMIDGALKVYVVNINDLTAESGLGGILEGLLGGAGRLLGGFFGGLFGGTLGGVAFPWMLHEVRKMLEEAHAILDRVGIKKGQEAKKTPADATADAAKKGAGSNDMGTLLGQAGSLATTVDSISGLFTAAAGGGPGGSKSSTGGPFGSGPFAETAQRILRIVQGVSHVVNGLILLVPMLVGAFASLLMRIDDIKLAIVDMLQFALRNALLLRAAVLATVFDTVAMAGRLAGAVIGIVSTAIGTVLESIFRIVHDAVVAVIAAIRLVSTGLAGTIDQLMIFLRDGVGPLLVWLGTTRIFRLVFHLAEVLPLVLPALATITGRSLSPAETKALTAAAAITPPRRRRGRASRLQKDTLVHNSCRCLRER